MTNIAPAIERRTVTLTDVEVRSFEDGAPRIRGYAAVFNTWTDIVPNYLRERIAPGAFKKTIKDGDVRALINHDPNLIIGRSKAGTLSMREDEHGLAVEITPPDTTYARDLITNMRAGNLNQMSFAFTVVRSNDKTESEDGALDRTLTEVRLYDVSVVTYPAYPTTEAWARSAIETLSHYLQSAPPETGHPEQAEERHSEPAPPPHPGEEPTPQPALRHAPARPQRTPAELRAWLEQSEKSVSDNEVARWTRTRCASGARAW